MPKIYLVQMESVPLEKEKNFEKAKTLILGARPEPGSIIVLPEMFATGYIPKDIDQNAESFDSDAPGATATFLAGLARETQGIVIGGGIQKKDGQYTNHAGIFCAGLSSESAGYDKNHPFMNEKAGIRAGKSITLFKTGSFTIAPTICYDLRFPELYRKAVQQGANLFVISAAWPHKRISHWDTLIRARAIENQAYVAAVNCVSRNGIYSGNSAVIDPFGNTLVQAESGTECVVCAEVDAETVDNYRQDFPVLKDI